MVENLTTAGSSLGTKFLKYWFPVLLMIGLMYWASTDVFSGENTRSVLTQIVLWLRPHTSDRQLLRINFIVRKMAHFTEYAVLAMLLYRAFRAEAAERWHWRWAAGAFGIVFCWALLDEYHQTLTHTRGGSIYDSLLDCSGALFMLAIIALSSLRRKSRGTPRPRSL